MNALDTWYAGLPRTASGRPSRALGADAAWPAEKRKRTPRAQKRVRAKQAELYVKALGLKGACEAMGLGPWQIHSLRRWLRGGPVPHSRAGRFKPKLSPEQRAEIAAAKGREKLVYLAALYDVNPSTIVRIWAEGNA